MKTIQTRAMDASGQEQIKPLSSQPRYRTWLARVGLLGYISLLGSQTVLAQTEISIDVAPPDSGTEVVPEAAPAPAVVAPSAKPIEPAAKALPEITAPAASVSPVADVVTIAAPLTPGPTVAAPKAAEDAPKVLPIDAPAVSNTPGPSAPAVSAAPATPAPTAPAAAPVIPAAPEVSAPVVAPPVTAPAVEAAAPTGQPKPSAVAEDVTPSTAASEAASNDRGFDVVTPTDLVPNSIPTAGNVPADFGSVFIDTEDYSVGATTGPNVVLSERSTGCEFTVQQGQGVSSGACGTVNPQQVATSASGVVLPSLPSPSATAAPSINIGPVSISQSGVRVAGTTTAASRDYYARLARPVVNLQLGEQFIFPLSIPAPITSLFGWRFHPIHGEQRFHAGTDLGAPLGTPVLATQAGQVAVSDFLGGYGLTVVLRHGENNNLESRYAHLSHLLVAPGEQVEKGDVIGLVGSTGNSTGPHLHFELRQLTAEGWVIVNPNNVLQYALANLMQTLDNPLQALNLTAENLTAEATADEKASPDAKSLPFRPAQPNAN